MHAITFQSENCMNCNSCILACAAEHSERKNIFEAIQQAGPVVPRLRFEIKDDLTQMISCNHCENAVCISSCPVGAITRDPDYGYVVIDCNRCVSCGICFKRCPEVIAHVRPEH